MNDEYCILNIHYIIFILSEFIKNKVSILNQDSNSPVINPTKVKLFRTIKFTCIKGDFLNVACCSHHSFKSSPVHLQLLQVDSLSDPAHYLHQPRAVGVTWERGGGRRVVQAQVSKGIGCAV